MKTQTHGFTLVELSIVLVILGLLIGGVLTGQTLIRAAELRSVTTQFSRYQAAVQTFRDKYFALPGDMTNATAYWGMAAGTTGTEAACANYAGTATAATCNGNGDGQVLRTSTSTVNEPLRFWQQLANAGLIEGFYPGVGSAITNTNSPVGRISGSLWYTNYWGPQTGNANLFDGQYDNTLLAGTATAGIPSGAFLKPEEIYNIDMKSDDGKPATGKIVGRATMASNTCYDTTDNSNMAANYALTNTALSCAIIFRQVF